LKRSALAPNSTKYVDIAALLLLLAGIRTEEDNTLDMIPFPEFVFQGPEDVEDFQLFRYVGISPLDISIQQPGSKEPDPARPEKPDVRFTAGPVC